MLALQLPRTLLGNKICIPKRQKSCYQQELAVQNRSHLPASKALSCLRVGTVTNFYLMTGNLTPILCYGIFNSTVLRFVNVAIVGAG